MQDRDQQTPQERAAYEPPRIVAEGHFEQVTQQSLPSLSFPPLPIP